jgi:Domain of unknown function (DUF4157)/D-alanyl-D-alanine carboxypeptidase
VRAPAPTGGTRPAQGLLRRKCGCSESSPECESCRKKGTLRRRTERDDGGPHVPEIVHEVLGTPGRPLDADTRAFMEPRFGHDFGRVRIHADSRAVESARAVDAEAYTVGHHVVLGDGHAASHADPRRQLLAHELGHVVQNERDGGGSASLAIGALSDPAERDADRAAFRALAGLPAFAGTPAAAAPTLRRKVKNSVVTDFQKDAHACMVHVHGEEHTALAVGKELRSRRCVNFMHLDTKKRHVDFDFTVDGFAFEGEADPNRIHTPAGRAGPEAIKETHPVSGQKGADKVPAARIRKAAEVELESFSDLVFIPKLEECRKNDKEPDAALPVVALHNNEGLRPDVKVASKTRSPNPALNDPGSPSDFILVTDPGDFDALKDERNVILQENPIRKSNDDGSLSVRLAASRYVNVEKEGREHDKPVGKTKEFQKQDDVYVKNYAMAGAVLDRFGVSKFPCFGAENRERRTKSLFNRRLGQSGRKTTMFPTDQAMRERDPVPDPPPKGCRVFKDQPAIDRAADDWRGKIENIPLLNLIHWALGGPDFTPKEPLEEFKAQQVCMTRALRTSTAAQGLTVPKGDIVLSEKRTFAAQEGIWTQKFSFTHPRPFDRISDFARKKCAPTLGRDVQWDPKNSTHKACWSQLTDDEKQKEILMASSAPGVSRHHAGVDFDIGQSDKDLDPQAWTGGGRFADAYRWLARNAATFGFIQPFDQKGGYGTGYMSERWHWSYYPVAQAVLEFVMDYDQEIEAALQKLWSDGKGGIKPEFSFIAKNWRSYLFNVEDLGVF